MIVKPTNRAEDNLTRNADSLLLAWPYKIGPGLTLLTVNKFRYWRKIDTNV